MNKQFPFVIRHLSFAALALVLGVGVVSGQTKPADSETVKDEHALIGVGAGKSTAHASHPDAQWYPDAGLGLFIHWGLSSVKAMNISWPMIPGRALANKKLDSLELLRVINERDYNLNG